MNDQMIKHSLGIMLLVLLMGSILLLKQGNIITGKPHETFTKGGDGFKNQATYIYHIKYGKDFLHYEGMNYPYGEHVAFTDNMPIITNILQILKPIFPSITNNIIPIMDNIMLFNFIIGAIFLLLLFRKYKIPDWYGIIASTGIMLLSPQWIRIGGHYALSYAMFMPIFLYILLLYEEKNKTIYWIGLFIVLIFFGQIHIYYIGMLVFTLTIYSILRYFYSERSKNSNYRSLILFGVAIIAFLIVKLWTTLGMSINDRPSHPFGFLVYRSYPESIFLSTKNPILALLNDNIIKFRTVPSEGVAFVGLASTIVFLILVYRWIMSKTDKGFGYDINQHILFTRTILSTVGLVLLFAMGIPFIIPGFEWMTDHLGPISQLRSIGRFSWVFYYTFTFMSFVLIYKYYESNSSKTRIFLMIFSLILLFVDGLKIMDDKDYQLISTEELKNDFSLSDDYWFKNIKTDNYQAILPIPYFHIGSEYFALNTSGWQIYNSTLASLISGIPNLGVELSRTSLSQTLKSIQLCYGGDYKLPKIIDEFPNQKPLLIVYDKTAQRENPTNKFDFLLDKSDTLFENKNIILLHLELDAWSKTIESHKNKTLLEYNTKEIYSHGDMSSTDSIFSFYYNNFDTKTSEKKYYSKSGLEEKQGNLIVLNNTIPNQATGKYEISFWAFQGLEQMNYLRCEIIEYRPDDNKILNTTNYSVVDTENIWDNEWRLAKKTFDIKSSQSKLKIRFYNPKNNTFWIDELLVKPINTDVYMKSNDIIWKNNLNYTIQDNVDRNNN